MRLLLFRLRVEDHFLSGTKIPYPFSHLFLKRESKNKRYAVFFSLPPQKNINLKYSVCFFKFFKKHFHEVVFMSNSFVTQFAPDNLYKYFLHPCGLKSCFLIMYMVTLPVCMSMYYVYAMLRRSVEGIRPPRTGVVSYRLGAGTQQQP